MNSGFRTSIAFKLVFVTVALILAVVIPISIRSSELFESSFGKSQNDANSELANSKSSEVDSLMLNLVEKTRTVTNLLLQNFANEDQRHRALEMVFFNDLDLVNVEIYQIKNGRVSIYRRETNEQFFKNFDFNKNYIQRVRTEKPTNLLKIFADANKVQIQNSSLPSGIPLFTIGVPFADINGVVKHVALADVRLDRLQKSFSINGARTLYLVDTQGTVLAHNNDQLSVNSTDLSQVPIVSEALLSQNTGSRGQKRFRDQQLNKWFVGAYSRTSFGPIVIAQAPEEIILEPAKLVKRDAYTIAGYVLSGALFFVVIFSISLTNPIENLHEATYQVAMGNFNIKAPVKTRDEVGELAVAFNHMVDGLKERDKIKNIFNKFHGSSVTEDLLKNDLNLGGTRKDVTVLFSDIRDFTKFSEGHTPEEVVEMLNEYFEIMVSIITSNNGIVDKFVGDAIMAVWGAPNSTGHDRESALKACLEMRTSLAELNERRISRQQPPVKIGIGLHSGPAISGTIGSFERMEYTVIGDTVNMASRIESSTKAFGADLLVSESVVEQLENQFVFEYAGAAEVKGKSQPIKMFKVRGFMNENNQPILIQTPYSDYEAGHADKVKVAS